MDENPYQSPKRSPVSSGRPKIPKWPIWLQAIAIIVIIAMGVRTIIKSWRPTDIAILVICMLLGLAIRFASRRKKPPPPASDLRDDSWLDHLS